MRSIMSTRARFGRFHAPSHVPSDYNSRGARATAKLDPAHDAGAQRRAARRGGDVRDAAADHALARRDVEVEPARDPDPAGVGPARALRGGAPDPLSRGADTPPRD